MVWGQGWCLGAVLVLAGCGEWNLSSSELREVAEALVQTAADYDTSVGVVALSEARKEKPVRPVFTVSAGDDVWTVIHRLEAMRGDASPGEVTTAFEG